MVGSDPGNTSASLRFSGTIRLSASNLIDADNVSLGDSVSAEMGAAGVIVLGQTNNLALGTSGFGASGLLVGGRKGAGPSRVTFANRANDSNLTINGQSGATSRTNVLVADNDVASGAFSGGVLDLTGGSFNATLTKLTYWETRRRARTLRLGCSPGRRPRWRSSTPET
jgi:hypothetical protein